MFCLALVMASYHVVASKGSCPRLCPVLYRYLKFLDLEDVEVYVVNVDSIVIVDSVVIADTIVIC